MRNVILSLLGILLIIVAIFGAKKIIANKKKLKPVSEKVITTVFVDTVKNTDIPIQISANGNLTAKRRVELYSEVGGVFKGGAKLFKTGQAYKKGQTLIRVDASEYYASVQSAKSNFYNLVVSIMPDLRLDYPEIYDKWKQYVDNFDMNATIPVLPESTSDKEKYFITGRTIYSSYYNVKNLEQRLSKYSIHAPFNGVLTEALITEGTLIRQGQKLGEFIDPSVYEIEVAVEKKYANMLKIGNSVELFEGNNNLAKALKGKVTRVNSSVNQETQTVTAFIELKGKELKEGTYLEVRLQAKEVPNAIKIDRGLLQEGTYIFAVRDNILEKVEVTPVYFSEKHVVVKGVPNGTVILSKSAPGAYVGMLVNVFDSNSKTSSEKNTETTTNTKK